VARDHVAIGNGSQTKSELSRLNIKVTRLDGFSRTAPGKATKPAKASAPSQPRQTGYWPGKMFVGHC
jgi:hypothetical protein